MEVRDDRRRPPRRRRGAASKPAETVIVKNATIWTQGSAGKIERGDLIVRDGKIVKVGVGLERPPAPPSSTATGKHVTPGLIDCHSHTAIDGGVNEGSNNVTAEVRIDDVIEPDDIALYRELAGGLTTAHLLHGSANSIGGQDAVVKLHYRSTRERMLVPAPRPASSSRSARIPSGRTSGTPDRPVRYPQRAWASWNRSASGSSAARHYRQAWEAYDKLAGNEQERREPPRRDLQLEAIAEILDGKRIIHSHCYRQDEILMLIRTAESFGVKIGTFQHVLEGYKVADEIAAHGAGGVDASATGGPTSSRRTTRSRTTARSCASAASS